MAASSLVRLSSKGKQGGLEWDSLLPCVCYQKEIIPRGPLLSAFPLTSYRPELGHTPTPRPETGVLLNQGSLPTTEVLLGRNGFGWTTKNIFSDLFLWAQKP